MPSGDPGVGASDVPAPARRWAWVAVAVLVGLPILVLIGSLAQRTWYPTGDQAQAELRMLSMPEDPPLLGAAGRIQDAEQRQGNHPGPLMFWTTWPLYALLGGSSWAFSAATALVNLAWLTTSVWLVKRRAGLAACAGYGITALVLIGGYGLDALSQPWNPWVSLLPFTVLLLSTWSAFEGDRWAPVLATAAGSYALQGHIGYLPVTVPIVGLALAAPVWRWWRASERGSPSVWAIPLAASVGLALLAWSGPIYDVATNEPNNVSKLIANFSEPSEDPIGAASAVEAVLQSANPVGAWVFGGDEITGSALPGLLLLAAWATVAVVVARRRTSPSLTSLNAVLAVVTVLGTIAVSRVFGVLYLYTFRWIVAIVALQVFATAWGIATLLPGRSAATNRRLAAGAAAVLVLLAGFTSVRVARQEIPYDQSWRMEQQLAPAVAAQLDPELRYIVRWDDRAYLGGLGFGLILDLERRGFDVGADPRFSAAVEPHRVRCPGDFDQIITVVTGVTTIEGYEADPALRKVADADSREDPERWAEAEQELLDLLAARGEVLTPAELERSLTGKLLGTEEPREVKDLAGELVLAGVPSAVFVQPAPEPVPLDVSPINAPCND